MIRRVHGSWLLAACLLALARPASGQDVRAARAAYEQGVAALQAGRYDEARQALEASLRLRPVPVVRYNLGLAYRALGRGADAVEAFERYLAAPGAGADEARLAAVRAAVAELRARLATLRVNAAPAGARCAVDDSAPGPCDETWRLDPGEHALAVTADGHEARREQLTLGPGEQRALDVTLAPVVVRRLVATPLLRPPTRRPRRAGPSPWVWVGTATAVVAVVAAGTAVGLGLTGDAELSDYRRRLCTQPPERGECLSAQRSLQASLDDRAFAVNALAGVAVAGGVVGVAVIVLALVLDRGDAPAPPPRVSWSLSPGRAALGVTW